MVGGGFKAATTDERQLRRWWGPRPEALIGVPTGIRFDVIDVDLQGPEASAWAQAKDIPLTRCHETRSGGRHYLFKPTQDLSNSTSKLAHHVDVRARGGYIIWWPAQGFGVEHPDELTEMPEWVVAALVPRARAPTPVCYALSDAAFSDMRVAGLVGTIVTAPVGERSSRLYWAARRFVEMVDRGEVAESFARELLLEAGERVGHPRDRCLSTIDSAFGNLGGQS